MKNKLVCIVASLALAGGASATTVTASGGTTGAQFVTSSGTLLSASNSIFQVGLWNGTTFTQFAASDASPIAIGTTGALAAGRWLGNFADTTASANAFNGQQIWFKVSVDLGGGSTGTAYFSGGQLFPNNAGGFGDAITIAASTLNTVGAGSTAGSLAFQAADGTYPNGRVVVGVNVVPEPSVALLGALGALGLIRRRR